jgi:polar amino acid transport system permease protein
MTAPRVVRLRRPWLWLASAAVLAIVAWLAVSILQNPHIDHAAIAHHQFAPAILQGLRLTVVLAVLAALIGTALGVALAVMRLSSNPVLRLGSGFYTWLLRGTPLLVQILIWGNLALLFSHIGPFDTNKVLTPFVASVVALGLNEAAYMAEIVRAGVLAVDRGQADASLALGMSRALAMRRIILPQALRRVLAPITNESITLLKNTSLVSTIALGDLLRAGLEVMSWKANTFSPFAGVALCYLALTLPLLALNNFLERRYRVT